MKTILFVLILTAFTSCFSQKRKITFLNQSDNKIDSLFIAITSAESYIIKVEDVKILDKIIKYIPKNIPKSNKHDVRITISVYINNKLIANREDYNDLTGYILNDYYFVFDKQNKIKLNVENGLK